MDTQAIITLITTILGAVAAVLTVLIKYIKSDTARKNCEKALEITRFLSTVLTETEKAFDKSVSGADAAAKKATAMRMLEEEARAKGIDFDGQDWDARIEELIKMSKVVNAK